MIMCGGGYTSFPPKRTKPMPEKGGSQAVVRNMQDGRYELYCPVCKISLVPELPCPLDAFLGIVNQFTEDHSHIDEEA